MKRLRKYKHLEKINDYLLDDNSSLVKFNNLVRSRAKGLNLEIDDYFFGIRNPLSTRTALKITYNRYRAVFDYLDKYKPDSILEIGCGTGIGAWILSDLTKRFIAIDHNSMDLKIAKKIFTEVEFVQANAYEYLNKVPAGEFDLLLSVFGPQIDVGLAENKFNKYIYVGRWPNLYVDRWPNNGTEISEEKLSRADIRKMILRGHHRLGGKHLSFNTTIVSNKQKGFQSTYPYYYFTDEYYVMMRRAFRMYKTFMW